VFDIVLALEAVFHRPYNALAGFALVILSAQSVNERVTSSAYKSHFSHSSYCTFPHSS